MGIKQTLEKELLPCKCGTKPKYINYNFGHRIVETTVYCPKCKVEVVGVVLERVIKAWNDKQTERKDD